MFRPNLAQEKQARDSASVPNSKTMNNEHRNMEQEESNVPFSSYIPNTDPDAAFATTYDVRFDPHSYVSPSWTPATTAPSLSYYEVPMDAGRGYRDLTIFERRGYANNNANVSCSDPTAPLASQYPLPLPSFNPTMWSPNGSSGQGGVEGSIEYFNSPLDTGTLSIAEGTSASPMGLGQDWAANMTPINTPYSIGSSGSLSIPDPYGLGLEESGMFAEEPFDTAQPMPVIKREDRQIVSYNQAGGTGKAIAQPGSSQGSKPDSSGRRKSSGGSKDTSKATSKKERKRKSSLGQDSQPPPVHAPRLRTAARRHGPENGHLPKPGESPEDQRARTSHNKVEKEYRNRLNREFELVIGVLPPSQAARGQSSRGKMSKADVIGTATATIQSLADEVLQLREKKRQLEEKKKKLQESQPS